MSSILRPARCSSSRHGEDRADAHLVGLAAGDREAAEDAQRLDACAWPPPCRDISTQAEAPSESWLALPAVMNWSSPRTGFSLARPSMLVSGRLPSSRSQRDRPLGDFLGLLVLDQP